MKPVSTLLAFCFALPVYASLHEIEGRVLSTNNAPVPGINVLVKGTANGTATDMNGYFRLSVPDGPLVLLFNFLNRKSLEHALTVRPGYQYQINVSLANKSQTFHKSSAVTAELPLHSSRISGTITDQNKQPLAGVLVTQRDNAFRTISDGEGKFSLPVAPGLNVLSFHADGTKPLDYIIQTSEGSHLELDVLLVAAGGKYRRQESFAKPVLPHPENP